MKQLNNEIKKMETIKAMENTTEKTIMQKLQTKNINNKLYNATINDIISIWNKYAGKQKGEKTYSNLKAEIENHFDNEIFFYASNHDLTITIRDITKRYSGDYSINVFSKNYKIPFISNENTIQKIDIDNLHIRDSEYIKNIETKTNELIKMHQKALKLQDELLKIASELEKCDIDAVKYEYIVKNYID